MEKIFQNKEFIIFLEKLIPLNYKKNSYEERKKIVLKFEEYAAIIQDRPVLKILFSDEGFQHGLIDTDKNEIIINQKALKSSFQVIETILHEGAHFITANADKYEHLFNKEEQSKYELNYSESEYFDNSHGYIEPSFGKDGYKNYFFQPCEYYSFKESYLKTLDIVGLIEKNYNIKNLSKKYQKSFRFLTMMNPTEIFSKEYEEIDIQYIQSKLVDRAKISIESEKRVIKELKEKSQIVLEKLRDNKNIEDHSICFFKFVWDNLNLNEKFNVIIKYLKEQNYNLNADEVRRLSLKDGIEVMESIQRRITNEAINIKIGSNQYQDYIDGLDLAYENRRKIERTRKSEIIKGINNVDQDLFYKYSKIGPAFFFLPSYQIINKVYVNNLQKSFREMTNTYGFSATRLKNTNKLSSLCDFLEYPIFNQEKIEKKVINKFRK